MEEGYRKVLERHRAKFRCAVTVERLFSPLVASHVLSSEELFDIQSEHSSQRVDRLLDLVQRKDYETFKKLCVVLETTYPYMLNCMFLGVEPPITTGRWRHFLCKHFGFRFTPLDSHASPVLFNLITTIWTNSDDLVCSILPMLDWEIRAKSGEASCYQYIYLCYSVLCVRWLCFVCGLPHRLLVGYMHSYSLKT